MANLGIINVLPIAAGAGLVINGNTISINPNATIQVAGVNVGTTNVITPLSMVISAMFDEFTTQNVTIGINNISTNSIYNNSGTLLNQGATLTFQELLFSNTATENTIIVANISASYSINNIAIIDNFDNIIFLDNSSGNLTVQTLKTIANDTNAPTITFNNQDTLNNLPIFLNNVRGTSLVTIGTPP